MFRKQPQEEQFQVLPAGTVVYRDGHYYRVHDYGLVEVPAPQELVKPEQDENTEEA